MNLGLFYHYLRVIGRILSTPAVALTYEACFAASCAHALDPLHALVVHLIVFTHYVALVAYDGMTTPQHKNAPVVVGSATWLEYSMLAMFGATFVIAIGSLYGYQMEHLRRSDAKLGAHAVALHASTERVVRNFLPAAVLNAVNSRSADGVSTDIVAWSFDPACLLQSDIVGFTALGSRISPEALCGYTRLFFPGSVVSHLLSVVLGPLFIATVLTPRLCLQVLARPLLAVRHHRPASRRAQDRDRRVR